MFECLLDYLLLGLFVICTMRFKESSHLNTDLSAADQLKSVNAVCTRQPVLVQLSHEGWGEGGEWRGSLMHGGGGCLMQGDGAGGGLCGTRGGGEIARGRGLFGARGGGGDGGGGLCGARGGG